MTPLRKQPWFRALKMRVGAAGFTQLLRATGWTSRVRRENEQALQAALTQHGTFLLATWHENIYFSTWMLRDLGLTALISSSRDGEAIYQVMQHFNFKAVRGSSTRGGMLALRELLEALKRQEPVAVTPDGPTGPLHQVQPGIVLLAKKTGLPILPWHYEVRDAWRLKSWDSHKVPKPFTSGVGRFGNAFYVDAQTPGARLEQVAQELEAAMKENVQEVQRLVEGGGAT